MKKLIKKTVFILLFAATSSTFAKDLVANDYVTGSGPVLSKYVTYDQLVAIDRQYLANKPLDTVILIDARKPSECQQVIKYYQDRSWPIDPSLCANDKNPMTALEIKRNELQISFKAKRCVAFQMGSTDSRVATPKDFHLKTFASENCTNLVFEVNF